MSDPERLVLPELSERLHIAADAAGVTPAEVYRRLEALGVTISEKYVYKLFSGYRSEPNYVLVAGFARALHVKPAWFFDELPEGEQSRLLRDYRLG